MISSFRTHSLSAQPIEAPQEQHIKPALTRVLKHLLELCAVVVLGQLLVDVLIEDCPTLSGGKLPERKQLVSEVLALVTGTDAGIDGTVHLFSLAKRARAAFLARSDRSFAVIRLAASLPPALPWHTGQYVMVTI